MRRSHGTLIGLGMLVLCETASAQTLADAYEREFELLQAERRELEQLIEANEKSIAIAQSALTSEIEKLTAELVRLRATNASRQTDLPGSERLRNIETQRGEIKEIESQIDRWLEARGAAAEHDRSLESAIQLVEVNGGIHKVSTELFDESGRAREANVIKVGEVAAVTEREMLLPVGAGGYRTVPAEKSRPTQEGVLFPALLVDPQSPPGIDELKRATLKDWLRAGGPLLLPILVLGALALGIVVERLIALLWIRWVWMQRRAQLATRDFGRAWNEFENRLSETQPAWLMAPFLAVVRHREMPVAKMEERATEALLRMRPGFSRRLSALSVTAAVAPLLGLLGTVTGMIATFSDITTHGTGDPRLLSDGISEALITTQVGLSVAIPALLLYTALRRWAVAQFSEIEELCLALMHEIEDDSHIARVDHGNDSEHAHHA